jgi:hypothetical protein
MSRCSHRCLTSVNQPHNTYESMPLSPWRDAISTMRFSSASYAPRLTLRSCFPMPSSHSMHVHTYSLSSSADSARSCTRRVPACASRDSLGTAHSLSDYNSSAVYHIHRPCSRLNPHSGLHRRASSVLAKHEVGVGGGGSACTARRARSVAGLWNLPQGRSNRMGVSDHIDSIMPDNRLAMIRKP